MNGYIYLLTDTRNGMQYVGKTNGNYKEYFTGGIIPTRIIKKYGKQIFTRTILAEGIQDLEVLNELEQKYIREYDTFDNGYNLTIGGDGGGQWIYMKTKEEIEIIADKKRAKMLNREFSVETRERMSLAKKGIPLTEEHKKNIRAVQSGENHPWFGRKHTKETKTKISNTRKGKLNPGHSAWMKANSKSKKKISIDGIEYPSMTQAAEKLGLTFSIVKYRCNAKTWPTWLKL